LLSVIYKLFKKVSLARIQLQIKEALSKEQVGFRKDRSCCEQVLSLVTHVENGFQERMRSRAVFLDLTNAYDTI